VHTKEARRYDTFFCAFI